MAKTFALVFGAVYLLVGVLGFILPSPLLGIFAVNPLHNVVHLAIGAAWLGAATMGFMSVRTVSAAIGVVLLLVAILGFAAPETFNSILDGTSDPLGDNLLHIATAALALYIGFMSPRDEIAARAA